MAVVTVKNIPDILYSKLKENALKNHRSINSEIIVCLENTLNSQTINPDEFLAQVRKLRSTIQAPLLTDKILRDARQQGRP
ncbi:MAG: Arc family DNA-binding protein [Calditrichaeota bacterium]|nr:MAG: Arc family DNA-binding protein [Calditrichota bacterium]